MAGIGLTSPEQGVTKESPATDHRRQGDSNKEESIKEPTIKKPLTKELPTKEPPTKELPTKEPPTKEPPTKEPSTKEPPIKESTTTKEPPIKEYTTTKEPVRHETSSEDRTTKCNCPETKTYMLKDLKNLSIPQLKSMAEEFSREITEKDRQLRKTCKLIDMLLIECRNFKMDSVQNNKELEATLVRLDKRNEEYDELKAAYGVALRENEELKKKEREMSSAAQPSLRLPRIHKPKRTRQAEEKPRK